jgi:hypothetical protein
MVYVYGITESPGAPLAGRRGLDERPLEACAAGGVRAVYSHHPEMKSSPPPTQENAWRHERVVEALMGEGAVLPARFGTVFQDESGLRAALAPHERGLLAGLERSRDHVELGLRVLWEPPAAAPAPLAAAGALSSDSGRAYMAARLAEERRRREEHQRAERLADELHAPLAAIAVENTRRVLTTPQTLMVAAYLVPRSGTEAFRKSVQGFAAAHPSLRVLCTGPWPPYHFVPQLGGAAEVGRG